MKTCSKCNQEFPATTEYFYNHAGRKDKLDTSCKFCNRIAKNEWNKNNKHIRAIRDKARYEQNKEHILEINRRSYQKNKEYHAVKAKAWRQANPDKKREHERKRQALKFGNGHSPYTEQEVLDLYGTNCNICSLPVDLTAPRKVGIPGWENGLHIDHVLPISKGGPDILSNVRATHGLCNITKNNKEEYEVQTA